MVGMVGSYSLLYYSKGRADSICYEREREREGAAERKRKRKTERERERKETLQVIKDDVKCFGPRN
jgi:hypothetical protein